MSMIGYEQHLQHNEANFVKAKQRASSAS